jgi:hypothetical protein
MQYATTVRASDGIADADESPQELAKASPE